MIKAPNESVSEVEPNGWMHANLFLKWILWTVVHCREYSALDPSCNLFLHLFTMMLMICGWDQISLEKNSEYETAVLVASAFKRVSEFS